MIEYISGTLTELNPTMAVVETAGVGFAVNISLGTYSALNGRQSVKLYVYEAIREDAYTLYGFATKEERQMFMLLVSVSGVGAGTARMILSSVSTAELRDAVLTGNERILKGVKGIGLKTAQRIIVDLMLMRMRPSKPCRCLVSRFLRYARLFRKLQRRTLRPAWSRLLSRL